MPPRHALPALWLMTDERMGDALWPALAALPRGAGVVFRHLATPAAARRALFERVRAIARRRGLMLLVAGGGGGGRGIYTIFPGRRRSGSTIGAGPRLSPGNGPVAVSVHDLPELIAAERGGADLVFLSPVYPTRTHPGAAALGRVRFGLIARHARTPVIALGGMTARRAGGLRPLGAHGWAAIDGLTPDQNRKAVPR